MLKTSTRANNTHIKHAKHAKCNLALSKIPFICLLLVCQNLANENLATQDTQEASPQTNNIQSQNTTQNLQDSSEWAKEQANSDTKQNLQPSPNENPSTQTNTQASTDEQTTSQNTPTKSAKVKHGFIGLEASYAGVKYAEKGTLGTTTGTSISPRADSSGGGLNIGIIGGYRHFFTQSIGLRGYANIDYFESQAPANLAIGTIQAVHYGINADFLMDFREIGVFFGLNVGGVHYFGNGVNRLKSEAKSSASGFSVRQNGVETAFQLGLQSAICKSVGLEIIAKIPFISHYFINKGDEANIISRQITQSYTIGARLLYHF